MKRPFRENVTFPIDSGLQKSFNVVEDLLSDQRWTEAIAKLQEIAQTDGKSLVLIQSGKPGECAIYVNVTTRCNLLLSKLSEEGRVAYRQKVDPQARRWLENWQRTRDESDLFRIVRQAYLSSYGDDALLALGEACWDRGDYSAARLWWEQLIPLAKDANLADYLTVLRYPDATMEKAAILARIVLCSILAGDEQNASDELNAFRSQYPLAEGWLAGQHGRFVDLLQETYVESQGWKRPHTPAEVSTFAWSPGRFQPIPEAIDVGALRWERPLSSNLPNLQPDRVRFVSEPLSHFPVVYDKIVLVNDADAIRAWNMLTGEPAWQSERRDPAIIYPSVPDEPALSPDKPCVGVPYYTMTIDGSRLYARMGSPVTCSSSAELRREFASDLVCLDLAQEGKLVWKFAANELFPDETPWRFEGSPVVADGRAYVVVCRRHPQLELVVACLDAADGRLLWQRPIGAFRATVDDSSNRISHLLLTMGGGRLFLSTDAGAIVALDVRDGRIEWAISYEGRTDETSAALSDPGRKGLLPVLFHGRYVFAAPNDVNTAFCIEADSGRIHWQYSYQRDVGRELQDPIRKEQDGRRIREKQWRQLLGVVPGGVEGRLIVSGNAVSSIDIQTGTLVWERSGGAIIQGSKGIFGRGLIADNQVFVPLRESIQILDAGTGVSIRDIPLKTPDAPQQGGNLTLAGGMLLVAQPNRLAAYSEYSLLKSRIEQELTQRPDDSALRLQLADLELAEGNLDAAVLGLDRLSESLPRNDPSWYIVRRKLCKILQQAGLTDFEKGKAELARDYWSRSLTFADDVTKRVDLIFDIARAEEVLKHHAAALRQLQNILDDERLSLVPRESQTAGRAAAQKMSQQIQDFGRDAYQAIEDAAAVEFAALSKASDRRGLQGLLVKYPHARVLTSARMKLVGLLREANEISEAYTILSQIRRDAADDRAAVESSLAMINLLESTGAVDATKPIWQSLSNQTPSIDVTFDGHRTDLAELARRKIQQSEARSRTRPSRVEFSWSHRLASDGHVIFPANDPPSVEHAAVLVFSKHPERPDSWLWQCLDWRTGRTRWQKIGTAPIKAVAWTAVHLLIGTEYGWQAFSPDTGRLVWQQSSLTECVPHIAGPFAGSDEDKVWPVLFDVDHGLRFYDSDDGQLLANLKPPERLHHVFGIAGGSDTGGSFSDRTTTKVTEPDRKTGEAGIPRTSTSITVLMQTVKPTRTLRAFANSPNATWTVEEVVPGDESGKYSGVYPNEQPINPFRAGPGILNSPGNRAAIEKSVANIEPWKDVPIYIDGQIISMTGNHQLAGTFAAESAQMGSASGAKANPESRSRQSWRFSNFATGQSAPAAFSRQGRLLVVVDGMQLVSFDAQTGQRKWSTGLTDFPLNSPLQQICDDGSHIFAASQGMFSGVSLHDGEVLFQNFLGDVAPQWRTKIAWNPASYLNHPRNSTSSGSSLAEQTLIAAWPIDSAGSGPRTIRLCDAATGTVRQNLNVHSEPQDLVFHRSGHGLVFTNSEVLGLRFAVSEVAARTGQTSSNSRP